MRDNKAKAIENRLRRTADRRGFALIKSRRRDPLATDYAMFTITDATTGDVYWTGPIEQVEGWLSMSNLRRARAAAEHPHHG